MDDPGVISPTNQRASISDSFKNSPRPHEEQLLTKEEIKEEPINIEEAKEEFKDFERKTQQAHSSAEQLPQAENTDKPPPFDLASLLQSNVQQRKDAGFAQKKMNVVFKNVTVVGQGADASSISTLLTPIQAVLNVPQWFNRKPKGTAFNILTDLTGLVKSGEMMLVLGRPGSGCSTLLRILSNQRENYISTTGAVTYGGIAYKDFHSFLGEAIYTAEEDVHHPVLTVSQTLQVALRTKRPAKKLPGQTSDEFIHGMKHLLLKMFGLVNQVHTPVGNEFIRGLSGGERKRLTIAETMTTRAPIQCWDCSTRGLDAASALDYTKSLRIMCDCLDKTTVASFYQASDDMYNLFDKVMLLDKGRCMYFGPAKDAKQYFLDMGFDCEQRKSTPDFLTGLTNLNERKIKPGYEQKVPLDLIQMEARYKESSVFQKVKQDIEEVEAAERTMANANDFRKEFSEQKARGVSANSQYTTNFYQQTRALIIREFELIYGDKTAIIGKVFAVISKAFIYATVFLFMPLTPVGAFSRGGALFTGVLFNSLISLSELPNAMRGRRILEKHKSYAFYHPAAYHLASVSSDVPIILLQVTVFSICVYFLEGLQQTAGHFFVYLFSLFLVSLCMTEVFRMMGSLSKSYFAAAQTAGGLLILLLAYTGFIIPYNQMHPWFSWIYWINPMAYAYKGIFSNEMKGLKFPCVGPTGVAPFSLGLNGQDVYANTDFQYKTCLMAGAKPGQDYVLGDDYSITKYGYDVNDMSIDIMAVFLFWILFIILNCVVMEYNSMSSGTFIAQVYKKGKAPKQNAVDSRSVSPDLAKEDKADHSHDLSAFDTGSVFTWENIDYTVPVQGGERQLLKQVEGWIKPGEMTALMGSSGAGKTTLLDVLSKRKTIGRIEGSVLLNGLPLRKDFERITGYVEQMDVHNPGLTVREALQFSAKMRQPPSVPLAEKYAYVNQVLAMMEMSHLGDAMIGDLDSGFGISVEERKRLTIGMELVGKPHILFLDEPTSGLDAQSSYNIVKFIRKLADSGMPLVCTIHQPSSILFEYFDRLLLLARGGLTVYFGPIGRDSKVLTNYFASHGAAECKPEENAAEYILRCIGAGTAGGTITQDWPAIWKGSKEYESVRMELADIQAKGKHVGHSTTEATEFATSTARQFWEVYKHLNLVYFRDPTYNFGRWLQCIWVGLIVGFSFFRVGNSSSDMQSRVFAIFNILILGNNLVTLAQPMFMKQRQFFKKEYASKFYGWAPFAVNMVLVEIPYLIVCATLVVFTVYWTSGLDSSAVAGVYFWLMFVMYLLFSITFGQVVAAGCATVVQASILNPFFTPIFILFAGVLTPPSALPKFWRSWMYWVDPFHYFLEGVVTDVLYQQPVVCKADDLIPIKLDPSAGTCGAYLAPYLTGSPLQPGTGYVANPTATSGYCEYCVYTVGDQFFGSLGWSAGDRWRNFGIMFAYVAFNIAAVVFFVRLFRKPKR